MGVDSSAANEPPGGGARPADVQAAPPSAAAVKRSRWGAIFEACKVLFALTGAVLGILGYLASRETGHRSRTLEIEAKLNQAWDALGDSLLDTGRVCEAEQQLREAVRLDARLAIAHANLGRLLDEMGKLLLKMRETQSAERAFREAVRRVGSRLRSPEGVSIRAGAACVPRERRGS